MFAIIKTGGKQYKVAPNDIIMVEKLIGTSGDSVEFKDVLMTGEGNSVKVGAPWVANAKVFGTVLDQIRDDKVIIFKKNRRHNYRRKNGHRQYLTVVRITDIFPEGGTPKQTVTKHVKKEPAKVEAKPAKPMAKADTKIELKVAKPLKKVLSKVGEKASKPAKKVPSKVETKGSKPAKKAPSKAKKPSKG